MAEKSSLKFLADENISPVLVQILRKLEAGFVESIHSKEGERGLPDEEWIARYTRRGYIILSLDRRQIRDHRVAQVVARSGARIIYLPSKFADSNRWDQALWLLRNWWSIVDQAGNMKVTGEVLILRWDGGSYSP